MKLAVAGKGGIGKTTVCAGLALYLAEQGDHVTAVDADPNNCLGFALGLPADRLAGVRPISEMEDLLAERAGSSGGGVYNLAPEVADIIEQYKISSGEIDLLVMGTIDRGGGGCACALNSTLKALLRELVALPGSLLVDMEAGLEHLGRGTASATSAFLVVTDATQPALRAANRITQLAHDLGIRDVWAVGNRASTEEQRDVIRRGVGDIPVVGFVREHRGLGQEDVLAGGIGQELRADLSAVVDELRRRTQSQRTG